ncbi:MAG: hypothetical protein J4F46_08615 [Dehalococcoidia bacterium]|nr:hypothetical protein [Dehalococcoidia bacterium]
MVNTKTAPYIAYFLVAAVILLALAAIIASRWGGASRQVQYTTCVQTEGQHDFDLASTVDTHEAGEAVTLHIEAKVSGDDFHLVGWEKWKKDQTTEYIGKDGEHYMREPWGSWRRVEHTALTIPSIDDLIDMRPAYTNTPSEYILCADEGENATFVGKTLRNDVRTIGDHVLEAHWEYWSNEDGHLYQSVQTFKAIEGLSKGSKIATEISNVGEPNVITAPVVP